MLRVHHVLSAVPHYVALCTVPVQISDMIIRVNWASEESPHTSDLHVDLIVCIVRRSIEWNKNLSFYLTQWRHSIDLCTVSTLTSLALNVQHS